MKHRSRLWTTIAGPLLLPVGAAVLVFTLSTGGAYIAAPFSAEVAEGVLTASAALAELVTQTAAVLHPE